MSESSEPDHVQCEKDEACALPHEHEGECRDVFGVLELIRETVRSSFSELKSAVRDVLQK